MLKLPIMMDWFIFSVVYQFFCFIHFHLTLLDDYMIYCYIFQFTHLKLGLICPLLISNYAFCVNIFIVGLYSLCNNINLFNCDSIDANQYSLCFHTILSTTEVIWNHMTSFGQYNAGRSAMGHVWTETLQISCTIMQCLTSFATTQEATRQE